MAKTNSAGPRWVGIPVRVFAMTFLFTLLTFAYRHIAFPCAITAGAIVLALSLGMEIRNYRQRKALDGIARVS